MATETSNGFTFHYSDTLKQALTNITRDNVNATVLTIPTSVTSMASNTCDGIKLIITDLIFEPSSYVGNLLNFGLGFTSTISSSTTLKTITLGGAIAAVGNAAAGGSSGAAVLSTSVFRSCSGLTLVTIKPSVTSNFIFGANCFTNCTTLTRITINTDDITVSTNNAFGNTDVNRFLPTIQDFYYRYYKSFAITSFGTSFSEFGFAPSSTVARYTVSGNSISVINAPAAGAGTSFRVIIPDSISSFINTTTPPGATSITKVGTGSALNTTLSFITSLGFYSGINTIDANAFTNASNITSIDLSNKPTLNSNCFSGCSSINMISLQRLKKQIKPYNNTELTTAGFSQTQRDQSDNTAAQLKSAGYTATQLKEAGYTAAELKTAGFNDSQLFAAGYNFILNMTSNTLIEVVKVSGSTVASFTVPTYEGAVPIYIIGNGTNTILTDGASVSTLIVSLGITSIAANAFQNITTITSLSLSNKPTLNSNCFSGCANINDTSLQQLKTQTTPYDATQLKTAGFSATQLFIAQFSSTQLKTAGYAASELKTAGFIDSQLLTAGYNFIFNMTGTTLTEVKKVAGSTLDTLTVPTTEGSVAILTIGNGTNAILTVDASVATLIVSSGIATIAANAFQNITTITSLSLTNKPILNSNCFFGCTVINSASLQRLKDTNGYTASELNTAGFNIVQLVLAGFKSSDMSSLGFTSSQVYDSINSVSDINSPKITAQNVLAAGYDFIFHINASQDRLTSITRVAGSTMSSLIIPESDAGVNITKIGLNGSALTDITGVSSITFSTKVLSIPSNVFKNATSITSITLNSMPNLAADTFFGCVNIDTASLQGLKARGYTVGGATTEINLRNAGFTVAQVIRAGFTVSQIYNLNVTNGYTASELTNAGYHFIYNISNVNVLTGITKITGSTVNAITIPSTEGGVSILTIGSDVNTTLATTVTSITVSSDITSIAANAFSNRSSLITLTLISSPTLLENCFNGCVNIDTTSLQRLRTINSYSATNLKTAGFTLSQQIQVGFSVSELKAIGYTDSDLLAAGYAFIFNISNVNVLTGITRVTGSTVSAITIPSTEGGVSILTIGSAVNSTLDTTITSITVSSGITSIAANAFSNRSLLTTLTLEGLNIQKPTLGTSCFSNCPNIDTTSLQGLKTTNLYSATELKTAGFSALQLRTSGYTVSEMKASGYLANELRIAGYTAAQMKDDYSISELKQGGYTIYQLGPNDANYSSSQIFAADFSSSELLAAGYHFIYNISNVNVLKGITRVTGSTVNAITIPSSDGGINILTIGSAVNSTLDTSVTSITISSGITSIQTGAFSNRIDFTTITLEGVNTQKPELAAGCFSNCPNINSTSIQRLKNTNLYTNKDLIISGFNSSQMDNAGISSAQVYNSGNSGITNEQFISAGYHFIFNISDVNVLTGITQITGSTVNAITIPYYEGGVYILTIGSDVNSTLATTVTSITVSSGITSIAANAFSGRSTLTTITLEGVNTQKPVLLENCFNGCVNIDTTSLQRLKTTNLYSASQLKTAGFSARQLQKGGYSATELQTNYTAQDILAAGYTVAQLKAAGYSAKQLKDAGYNDADILAAGYPVSQLKEAGFLASQLKAAGYSASELKAVGYSASELKAAGYLAAELKAAEYTIADLKGAGYDDAAILAAGYSASQLKAAGYSAFQLKDADYTVAQLREGGYNDTIILASGYSVQALKAAGYTASQLRTAGFTALEILSGGYDEQAVIDAFSTSGTSEPYVPCFNENSKILCLVDGIEKELLVQNIRNGILVKTLCSGYIPVCMIGTKKIYNPGNNERTTERLYICKREMYPELNQDLIITGCHSILVDEFTDVQREKTLEKFNDIFVTDDKYRLIAAFDERAEPYNNAGEFNIYHFALENENYYYNYGIYANGLLVETCSKRYLKEKTDMTLL